ncbi:Ras-related GTPase [Ceraceosorus bombacis]|uniref:Ras-related GTPase n=1 Tax=Ceraceosorus bombacis TaxID=401625 RepID=A0A0P1BDP7_9BASI|nr:Ras-related GTPase [Ceraceosorus bombacis]
MPSRSDEASSSRQQYASTSTISSQSPGRRALKVVLIGSAGVGKTALRDHWHTNRFNASYRATIGADFVTKQIDRPDPPPRTRRPKGGTISVAVWDTAGQERFRSLGRAFYRGADAVILAYDVTRPETLCETKTWWADFKSANGFHSRAPAKGAKGAGMHHQHAEDEAALQTWLKTVTLVAVGCKADLLSSERQVDSFDERRNRATSEAQKWFDGLLRQRLEEPREAGSNSNHKERDTAEAQHAAEPYEMSENNVTQADHTEDHVAASSSSSDSGPTARPPLSTRGSDPSGRRPNSTTTIHAQPTSLVGVEPQQPGSKQQVNDDEPADAQLHARRSIASINLVHAETEPDPERRAPNAGNSRIVHSPEAEVGEPDKTAGEGDAAGNPEIVEASSTTEAARDIPTTQKRKNDTLSISTSYGITPPATRANGQRAKVARTPTRVRGRYDSAASVASTIAGGASLYHTPRGSTMYSFNSSSSEESRQRAEAVARTPRPELEDQTNDSEDGGRTPRGEAQAAQGSSSNAFDVSALDRALHQAQDEPGQGDEAQPSASEDENGAAYSQQIRPGQLEGEPIPFPSTPSADRIADVRRAARSRKGSSNAARTSGARSKSRMGGDKSNLQPPALELPARPTTLYEAPPVSVGSGFLHRAAAEPSGASMAQDAGAHRSLSLDEESVRSESDYDAACEDDEEPTAPAQGFVLHLTSAKTGQGVSGVFEELIERVSQRWEVEEWEERQAQYLNGGFGVDVDGKTKERNAKGKGWWRFGRGQQNVELTWEQREEIQVRRGIRIAAGKEPRNCCGT